MSEENRISIDPEICHGKPCIKGNGLSFKEILEEYPHITVDDIKACIKFAKALINNEEINLIVNTGVSS
ncbi:MAG: DUF433 domain-containing protein [Candidatus Helarchaeota archaeon]